MSSESQKERREYGAEKLFEKIMAEHFPNLANDINL